MLGSVARVRPPRPRGVLGTSPSQQEKVSKISTRGAVRGTRHPRPSTRRRVLRLLRHRRARGPPEVLDAPTRCSRSRRRAASTRPRAPPRGDASRGGDPLRASPGRHDRAIAARVVRSSRSRRARARRTTSTARGPQSATRGTRARARRPRGRRARARHAGPRVSGWSACLRPSSRSFRASSSHRRRRRARLTTRFWRLCGRNRAATRWRAVPCRRG